MKIVKFKDGKYGIRQWNWFFFRYEFKDLDPDCPRWFGFYSIRFKYCKGTLPAVKKALANLDDVGEPFYD
jgi:hypothetical protein